jgi:hypothetical protein
VVVGDPHPLCCYLLARLWVQVVAQDIMSLLLEPESDAFSHSSESEDCDFHAEHKASRGYKGLGVLFKRIRLEKDTEKKEGKQELAAQAFLDAFFIAFLVCANFA